MDDRTPTSGTPHDEARPDAGTAIRTTGATLEWNADPIDLALLGSSKAQTGDLPTALCVEIGRRLLLAELQFSSWVLRRVETVSLGEGRSVLRKTSIEFKIRDDAPCFVTDESDDGSTDRLWLVPLAIMKRRTLVDFHLTNEDGTPLTLPGLRLTQQLDESILLAAAATAGPPGREVREFVRDVVAGDRPTVTAAMDRYEAGDWGRQLQDLRKHTLFQMTLERLRFNFTLYVVLKESRGRHRLLHMSFVEPITWRYQYPKLDDETRTNCWSYTPMIPAPWSLSHLASELGLSPTRVRFQTPAAENAASYHVELVAPPGVRIVDATLLAGRPHVDDKKYTLDHERGALLTVGLHGVEVPRNSLCRTQVRLRVQRGGWLTTLLYTVAAIFLVLLSVALHAQFQEAPDPDQDTNIIVLLVTATAAAAAFLTQREFSGVAARMLTGMRTVGAIAMALPVLAAGFLGYKDAPAARSPLLPPRPEPADVSTTWATWVLTGVAFALLVLVFTSWWRTRRDEAPSKEVSSAWNQSRMARLDPQEDEKRSRLTFQDALTEYGFRRVAVGVQSSEGWHHVYRWTTDDYERGIRDLEELATSRRAPLEYRCGDPGDCPHTGIDGCPVRWRAPAGNFAQEQPTAAQTA